MCGCKAESSCCHAKRACQEVSASHAAWATADTSLMLVVEKHWDGIARNKVAGMAIECEALRTDQVTECDGQWAFPSRRLSLHCSSRLPPLRRQAFAQTIIFVFSKSRTMSTLVSKRFSESGSTTRLCTGH